MIRRSEPTRIEDSGIFLTGMFFGAFTTMTTTLPLFSAFSASLEGFGAFWQVGRLLILLGYRKGNAIAWHLFAAISAWDEEDEAVPLGDLLSPSSLSAAGLSVDEDLGPSSFFAGPMTGPRGEAGTRGAAVGAQVRGLPPRAKKTKQPKPVNIYAWNTASARFFVY